MLKKYLFICVTLYLILINNREGVFMTGDNVVTGFANIWKKKGGFILAN